MPALRGWNRHIKFSGNSMNPKRNLSILFFTLVIMMMGFGIIIPILPDMVTGFGGSGKAMGALMAIFSAMQFLFSPMWGELSDKYGRKPILLIGVLGNGITMLLLGLSTELWMMFAARGLAGVLSSATLPTAYAFIGDSTNENDRGGGMGIVGAAMGLGMVLGPAAGGYLGSISLQAPFFFAAAMSIVAMVAIWFFLPESLPVEKRKVDVKVRGPQIKVMLTSLYGPLGFLLIASFMISFAMTNFEGIYGYYAKIQYGYGPRSIGYILTIVGITSTIAQGALTGFFTKKFGEVSVIKVSLFASVLGFLVLILPKTMPQVLTAAGIFVLSNAMLRPAVAALISKRTPIGQGIAMGLTNSYMSLGRVAGPLWAGFVIDIHLNLPFVTGATFMLIGFITSLFFLKRESSKPNVNI